MSIRLNMRLAGSLLNLLRNAKGKYAIMRDPFMNDAS